MFKNSQIDKRFPFDRSRGSVLFILSLVAILLAWITLPTVILPLNNSGPLNVSGETSFWYGVASLVLSISGMTLRHLARRWTWINPMDHRFRDLDTIVKVLGFTHWLFWISVELVALFSPPIVDTFDFGCCLP
jgi:hypothetical protein